ncbi:MAG: hypothetical protein U0X41_08290 [Chitinophagales bacterium]
MNKIRKYLLQNRIVILLTAIVFTFSSCSTEMLNIDQVKTAKTQAIDFTGEELFCATIFFNGEASKLLGEFKELNLSKLTNDPLILEKSNKFQTSIIEYINKKDKSFFTRFKSKITSGELETVNDALTETSFLLCEFAKSNTNIDYNIYNKYFNLSKTTNSNIEQSNSIDDVKRSINVITADNDLQKPGYVHIAIAVETAVVAVILVVAMIFWAAPQDAPSANSFFKQEYLSTITNNFSNQNSNIILEK